MTLAVGSEAPGTVSPVVIGKGEMLCEKVTPSQRAKITSLSFVTSSTANTATSVRMYVCKVSGGNPGAVIASATHVGTPAGSSTVVCAAELVEGIVSPTEEVYLCILAVGGNVHLETTGLLSADTNKTPGEITEYTGSNVTAWIEKANKAAFQAYASGTVLGASVAVVLKTGTHVEAPVKNNRVNVVLNAGVALEVNAIAGAAVPVYYGPGGAEGEAELAKWKLEEKEPALQSGTGVRYLWAWTGSVANSKSVIFLHGGGDINNQWRSMEGYGQETSEYVQLFAPAGTKTTPKGYGFAVFNVNYRDPPSVNAARQLEDIVEGFKYVASHAAAYNGQTSGITVIAGSAGCGLALRAMQIVNAEAPGTIAGIAMLSPYGLEFERTLEDMESGAYREYPNSSEPTVKHAGGSVPNLIEHAQEYLEQELNYTGSGFTPAWSPPIHSYASKTNATASRTKQRELSAGDRLTPGAPKLLMFKCAKDLIEPQWITPTVERLEREGKNVKLHVVESGLGAEGHSFAGLWTHAAEPFSTKRVNELIALWIKGEAPFSPNETLPVLSVGVGVTAQVSRTVPGPVTVASGTTAHVAISRSFAPVVRSGVRASVVASRTFSASLVAGVQVRATASYSYAVSLRSGISAAAVASRSRVVTLLSGIGVRVMALRTQTVSARVGTTVAVSVSRTVSPSLRAGVSVQADVVVLRSTVFTALTTPAPLFGSIQVPARIPFTLTVEQL